MSFIFVILKFKKSAYIDIGLGSRGARMYWFPGEKDVFILPNQRFIAFKNYRGISYPPAVCLFFYLSTLCRDTIIINCCPLFRNNKFTSSVDRNNILTQTLCKNGQWLGWEKKNFFGFFFDPLYYYRNQVYFSPYTTLPMISCSWQA